MKKIHLLLLPLLSVLISCNANSAKQTLPSEEISDNVIIQNSRIQDSVASDHSEKSTILVSDRTVSQTISNNDTTIYEIPPTTAVLEKAIEYFRANNKYKNWNKDDKKLVILKCIAEKDGSISNIRMLRNGSGNSDLDNEAIRLVKQAKLSPARNEKNEVIRSYWTIAIHFPSE